MPEAEIRLHLDADASRKSLARALRERGHDVTRTPNPWMPFDASDHTQLLTATAQKRVIFTFNIRDFTVLGRRYADHAGIVLAAQRRWTLPELIGALDRFLREAAPEQVRGQILWLNQWREDR